MAAAPESKTPSRRNTGLTLSGEPGWGPRPFPPFRKWAPLVYLPGLVIYLGASAWILVDGRYRWVLIPLTAILALSFGVLLPFEKRAAQSIVNQWAEQQEAEAHREDATRRGGASGQLSPATTEMAGALSKADGDGAVSRPDSADSPSKRRPGA